MTWQVVMSQGLWPRVRGIEEVDVIAPKSHVLAQVIPSYLLTKPR